MENSGKTLEQLSTLERGLTPLLYRTLKAEGRLQQETEEANASLRRAYFATLARNLLLNKALVEVLAAFEARGIRTIVLKGAILAETVYPDIGTRPMADVDLLISPADLPRVERALEGLGYQFDWSGKIPQAFRRRFGSEVTAYSERRHAAIDVHWDLLGEGWFRRVAAVDHSVVWANAQPVTFEGVRAWHLSPEHTLLHLCLHLGLHHHYQGLIWYTDIDRLIRAQDIAWDRFTADVIAFKLKTVTYLALTFTRQLLGTPIPEDVLNALRPSRHRLRFIHRFVNRNRAVDGKVLMFPSRGPFFFHLFLIDDWRDVLRLLFSVAFPGGDWIMARYEVQRRWMLPLYYPFHWARALAHAASAMWHVVMRA